MYKVLLLAVHIFLISPVYLYAANHQELTTAGQIPVLSSSSSSASNPLGADSAQASTPIDVDYTKIMQSDTDVIMFGENHASFKTKQELTANISIFADNGFNYLGLEMFAADVQYMLDEYCGSSGGNEAQLRMYLNNYWGYGEVITEGYLDLMRTALREGIRIIALDMPLQLRPDPDKQIAARDRYMAAVIDGILANDATAKIITLNGAMHIQPVAQEGISGCLSQKYNVVSAVIIAEDTADDFMFFTGLGVGLGTYIINYLSSISGTDLDEYVELGTIKEVISINGLSRDRFMSQDVSFCDWIIHIP